METFPRLQERLTNLGGQLSGGEQQMLSIGRALMTHPALIVLDEATEGLAPLIVAEIWRRVRPCRGIWGFEGCWRRCETGIHRPQTTRPLIRLKFQQAPARRAKASSTILRGHARLMRMKPSPSTPNLGP